MELNTILDAVSIAYSLTPERIRSKQRDNITARARQVAMYIMRMNCDDTLKKVGLTLGGRTPSTISHGFQKVANDRLFDRDTRRMISRVNKILGKLLEVTDGE